MPPRYFLPIATLIIGIALGFFASSLGVRTSEATLIPSSLAATATSTYRSAVYHLSLDYPSDLAVTAYADAGEPPTIVFQQPAKHVGFQVFVEEENNALSSAEIVREHPGFTAADVTQTTVGTSTPAFTFTDDIPGFGTVTEVWFSNDHRRYQFVTSPYLESWLTQILTTFRFDAVS